MDEMDRYVTELSTAVWEQTLGLPLLPIDSPPHHDGEQTVEGHIHITGEWTGTVVFQCSRTAAQRAAHLMFGEQEDTGTKRDVQDAVGELTNMIGGNIKSLMSTDGCYLSLPTVIEGSDYHVRTNGSRVVVRQAFESGDEPVVVTLLEPKKH